MILKSPNKFLQTDQIMLSYLLQKTQKLRQHALAAEERRYDAGVLTEWIGKAFLHR